MIRNILAVLLNLITFIGGHFLIRRWDRAVFILGLLILLGGACFTYLSVSFEGVIDADDALNRSLRVWQIFMYGALSIWLLSLLLTLFDLRKDSERVIGGVAGYFGAFVLSLMTLVMGLSIAWSLLATNDQFNFSSASEANKSYFHENITFGIISGSMREYGEPPVGEATITGMVSFNNQPVEGVTVRLGLNDQYRTKKLISGKDGRFTAYVQAGDWKINRVEVDGWRDRPEGDFIVLSGHEPRLIGSDYNEHKNMEMQGLPVIAAADNKALALELVIKPKLSMEWPPIVRYQDRNKIKTNATLENNSIAWQPYEGASKYVVRISRVEPEGNTTSYHNIGDYLVTTSTFPLTELMSVKGSGEQKEYSVQLYAFDEQGDLLSESDTKYGGASFVLTDGNELVKKQTQADIRSRKSREQVQEYVENKKRLDAVKILIDEDLLDEAEALMAKMTSTKLGVSMDITQGYLAAKRGNCTLANSLFEKAKATSGKACVPVRYQAICVGK